MSKSMVEAMRFLFKENRLPRYKLTEALNLGNLTLEEYKMLCGDFDFEAVPVAAVQEVFGDG